MTLTDGHYVAISTYTAGNHLEKIVIDYQNYHATICFYAGKAPIGSFVNVCMTNNYKFTVNPELVNISSPSIWSNSKQSPVQIGGNFQYKHRATYKIHSFLNLVPRKNDSRRNTRQL